MLLYYITNFALLWSFEEIDYYHSNKKNQSGPTQYDYVVQNLTLLIELENLLISF
jgi:hypothetical protein